METKIKWNEGEGYITATYEGSGNGSASISSDVNEGIDREQSIKVETTDKSVSATLVVSQEGLREVFFPSDGNFVLADGGTYNVLKSQESGEDNLFPAIIVGVNWAENLSNATIAQYFLDKYPDMFVGINGRYTNISEDVTITGTEFCDGEVVGVARYTSDLNSAVILFYTENSLNNLFGLRVVSSHSDLPTGSTSEIFFD